MLRFPAFRDAGMQLGDTSQGRALLLNCRAQRHMHSGRLASSAHAVQPSARVLEE